MSVRISSRLPTGDKDGLQAAEQVLRDDQEPIVIVAVIAPRSIADILDRNSDPIEIVCAVRAIEVMRDDDAVLVDGFRTQAYERRTGNVALPFGLVMIDPEEAAPGDSPPADDPPAP